MIEYPHFALSTIYLRNGYSVHQGRHGLSVKICAHEGLESRIRDIIVSRPERFNGAQLRFIRRGLRLTQADFAALIERDEQTVARMEKSSQLIPSLVELFLRTLYRQNMDGNVHFDHLLKRAQAQSHARLDKIIFSFDEARGWEPFFEASTKYATAHAMLAGQFPHKLFKYSLSLPKIELTQEAFRIQRYSSHIETAEAPEGHASAPKSTSEASDGWRFSSRRKTITARNSDYALCI